MKSFFLSFLHVIWKLGVNIESPWEEPQPKRPEHHRWVQQTDHSSSLVERQTQEWKEDPEMFGTHFKACNVKPHWLEGQRPVRCSHTDQKHQHDLHRSKSTDTGLIVQSVDVHQPTDSTRLLHEDYVDQIVTSLKTNQLSRRKSQTNKVSTSVLI